MNNAYGKSEEYHPEKILEEQQRFKDRNIENSMRYAPQSTPTKRTLSKVAEMTASTRIVVRCPKMTEMKERSENTLTMKQVVCLELLFSMCLIMIIKTSKGCKPDLSRYNYNSIKVAKAQEKESRIRF